MNFVSEAAYANTTSKVEKVRIRIRWRRARWLHVVAFGSTVKESRSHMPLDAKDKTHRSPWRSNLVLIRFMSTPSLGLFGGGGQRST